MSSWVLQQEDTDEPSASAQTRAGVRGQHSGCVAKTHGDMMGVKPHLLLSLGGHCKEAGDEPNLPQNVPFFHATYLPFPHHVHDLVSL